MLRCACCSTLGSRDGLDGLDGLLQSSTITFDAVLPQPDAIKQRWHRVQRKRAAHLVG